MTKEEFAERWGYQPAIGYGQALFDCKKQLLIDLEKVIKNISLNPDVIKSVYCVCENRSTFYRDKEYNDICYDCDLMIKQ